MKMDIKIRLVGRKKADSSSSWLETAYETYETRLRPTNVAVETIWHKNDIDLVRSVQRDLDRGHCIVLLDGTRGQSRTSNEFANDLYHWLEMGGSRLCFVIGGADGLPSDLLLSSSSSSNKRYPMLSLSSMTFTHQFARTILMEQIYRATEIQKGSGYHK